MKKFCLKTTIILVIFALAESSLGFMNYGVLTASADSSLLTISSAPQSSLQTQIDTDNQQIAALNQQIAQYQAELQQVGANKKTLQTAINSLDLQRNEVQAQVAVTQSQINSTQLQLQELGDQIASTKQNISSAQQAITEYIQNINQSDGQSMLFQLISSGNLSDFWQNYDETVQVQDAVQTKSHQLQTEEATLAANQSQVQQTQSALTAQNQSLTSQQKSLNQTVASKNQLLAETNSKESTYQKLLSQAEAELNSFSNFTKNAGGDNLLTNQTVCDSWGCYYNQRDSAWGADPLDGTNYSMAGDGCLVTAMAMVMTHYGYTGVTPATINSDPNNFAAYYPAYLLTTITAGGGTATRVTAAIDSVLATGNPVVIGMHVYGGTHFVVLISGGGGSYVMRDPYLSNGIDINFSSYYSLGEIYSIAKVVIS
jgi:peptidoglycan hydrolase CwlO-like protein